MVQMVGVHGSLCSGTLRRHYRKAGYGLRRGEVTLAFFSLPVLFEEGLYRRLKCVYVCVCVVGMCVCVCVSEEGKKVFLKKVYRRFEVCVYMCVFPDPYSIFTPSGDGLRPRQDGRFRHRAPRPARRASNCTASEHCRRRRHPSHPHLP